MGAAFRMRSHEGIVLRFDVRDLAECVNSVSKKRCIGRVEIKLENLHFKPCLIYSLPIVLAMSGLNPAV
jgi:hypothetical protein